MASFERRGSAVRAIVRVDGRKLSQTFDTLTEARAWAARLELRKARGEVAIGQRVEELLAGYMDADTSDSARWNSIRILAWLKERDPLHAMSIGAVTTHDIDVWIARRLAKHTPATTARELTLLSAAFTWAVKARRWLSANPCHGCRRPPASRPRSRPLLTAEELAALKVATGYDFDPELRALGARVGAAFLLAMETGMRAGELMRIRPQDYWRDRRTVYVSALERGGRKGGRSGQLDASRHVPLTGEAVRLLDQLMLHPGEPHIVGVADASRDQLFRRAVKRAGIADLHFHDSRHEAATRLARHLDALELSHALGIKDLILIRDTYYVADASRSAARLPEKLGG